MEQETPLKRSFQFLAGAAALWLFLVGFIIVQLWPDLPKSKLEWFLLVVVGPPIYILGEGFFGWLFSKEHGEKISSKRFSWLRIAFVFSVVLFIFLVSIVVPSILKS